MFQIVLQQLLEDKQRTNRVVTYAAFTNQDVYGTITKCYDVFMQEWQGDPNDTSLAMEVTDGIYVQMGVELGL
jgi:hypothetical protein